MWDTYLKGFESYLLLEKSYSKNTQEAYLRDCKRLIDYCQESYPNLLPKELKFSHINKFLTSLQKPKEEKIETPDPMEEILKLSKILTNDK